MNASLRAAVIAEWRGLPANKTKPDRWQAPGDLLPKLMQQLGLSERLREAEVIEAWKQIVGDFISAHSAPVSLRAGVLFVRVLQPSLRVCICDNGGRVGKILFAASASAGAKASAQFCAHYRNCVFRK